MNAPAAGATRPTAVAPVTHLARRSASLPGASRTDVACLQVGFADTSLGCLLVATSDRGLCLVSLADERTSLLDDLVLRFPRARRVDGGTSQRSLVAGVAAVIDGMGRSVDVPLDLRGTAFQRAVWSALRDIPVGETRTYAQVAAAIGHPSSVRAVASACGANPVAVLVPCHRVVRRDGTPSGYRWGLARKAALLAREQGTPP